MVEQKGAMQKEDGTWDNNNNTSNGESYSSAPEVKKDETQPQNGTANGASSTPIPEAKKEQPKTQNGTNGEAANVGDKRKAEEPPTLGVVKLAAETGEKEAKKQKTNNGSAAPNGKKGPGRPKGSGEKKEKKAARVGTTARKTRSQGKAE